MEVRSSFTAMVYRRAQYGWTRELYTAEHYISTRQSHSPSSSPMIAMCFCHVHAKHMCMKCMLELRQDDALRSKQGLDSERAQYSANCYRSSTARVAAVMVKATVMRLSGTPLLPYSRSTSSSSCASFAFLSITHPSHLPE